MHRMEYLEIPNDIWSLKASPAGSQDFPALPAAQIHLHKAIPMRRLGGGSARWCFCLDAEWIILWFALDDFFLEEYAFEAAGSDCPFFIENNF